MTTARVSAATPPPQASENGAINPRWLSELQGRLKKSLALKIAPEKAETVKDRLAYLDQNWLMLSAGREGFLAEPERRGVDGHAIQWGDMVRIRYPSDGMLNLRAILTLFAMFVNEGFDGKSLNYDTKIYCFDLINFLK